MRRLSGFDALFVYDEGPRETQHTLKVCFLSEEASRGHDFEKVRRGIRSRFAMLPLLHWRIARIPFDLHHPVWIEAETVDLDHHVRRRRLPSGAGRDELCRVISEIASEPLDPERPLWECWFLEGYQGEKVVVVTKTSHALGDGGAFVDWFERALFTSAADPEAVRALDRSIAESAPPVVERPSRVKLLGLGLSGLLRDTFVRAPRLARTTIHAYLRRHEARDLIPRPRLSEAPKHAFGGPLGPRRAFYFTAVPLASAKEIAKTFGVTINDVVIAVAAGAVRSYLQKRETLPEGPLVGSMAASIRRPEERGQWGNRVTTRTLRLPTHLADPAQRLRYSHTEASEAKRDIELRTGAHLSEWIGLAPPFVLKLLSKLLRYAIRQVRPGGMVILSNVRGPTSTLYTSYGPVENIVSVGHVKMAVALNITVWSYVEKLNFGLYTDSDAFPHLDEMADHIDWAFAELADAAVRHPSSPRGSRSPRTCLESEAPYGHD